MDATGAEALGRRMAQQAHWQQADAVRDGRQPGVDPDGDSLSQFREGVRLYSFPGLGERLVYKHLVDGVWRTGGLVESSKSAAEGVGQPGKVA